MQTDIRYRKAFVEAEAFWGMIPDREERCGRWGEELRERRLWYSICRIIWLFLRGIRKIEPNIKYRIV